jgi:NADPH:quinone reductase-like Zn-dependent oxidoreductase
MKAAIVLGAGQTPVYGDFSEPQPSLGDTRIAVTAAAISHVVKSRASGTHYSASGQFPFVVGIDGVGRLDDGSRVYFVLPPAPYGSMAQRTVVPLAQCLALPDELDDVTAAAIANPGMSSWAAYTERAKLKTGETVLVNGATGTAGRLAVQIAKHLGAKKVIATARNADALTSVAALGADVTIRRERGSSGRSPQGAVRRRRGCRRRLPVGKERGAPSDCRCEGRTGCRAHQVRPNRICERLGHYTARRCAALVGD